MTKLSSINQHKVRLDLGLELIFEDEGRMQAHKAAMQTAHRDDGQPVARRYRLVGINVLEQDSGSEIRPFCSATRGASWSCIPFENAGESFQISRCHS
jgi:hypothetical protein